MAILDLCQLKRALFRKPPFNYYTEMHFQMLRPQGWPAAFDLKDSTSDLYPSDPQTILCADVEGTKYQYKSYPSSAP
jgi:hypothetical protein